MKRTRKHFKKLKSKADIFLDFKDSDSDSTSLNEALVYEFILFTE
jgi:hypothetical protein